jgi:hypothetical protein
VNSAHDHVNSVSNHVSDSVAAHTDCAQRVKPCARFCGRRLWRVCDGCCEPCCLLRTLSCKGANETHACNKSDTQALLHASRSSYHSCGTSLSPCASQAPLVKVAISTYDALYARARVCVRVCVCVCACVCVCVCVCHSHSPSLLFANARNARWERQQRSASDAWK